MLKKMFVFAYSFYLHSFSFLTYIFRAFHNEFNFIIYLFYLFVTLYKEKTCNMSNKCL